MLFELIWAYRFLYRDLNELLSNNRKLETQFPFVLQRKTRAVQAVLDGLGRGAARSPSRAAMRRRWRRRWWWCSPTG